MRIIDKIKNFYRKHKKGIQIAAVGVTVAGVGVGTYILTKKHYQSEVIEISKAFGSNIEDLFNDNDHIIEKIPGGAGLGLSDNPTITNSNDRECEMWEYREPKGLNPTYDAIDEFVQTLKLEHGDVYIIEYYDGYEEDRKAKGLGPNFVSYLPGD